MSSTGVVDSTGTTTDIPTWSIDKGHSSVEFSVRHMVVATFVGRFTDFDATLQFDENRLDESSVSATIDVASVDTGIANLDAHLRGEDFFNTERFPWMKFESLRIERDGGGFIVYGNLAIRDVSKPVVFEAKYGGQVQDSWGNVRTGFDAETTINRKDFGFNYNVLLDSGGAILGDTVKIMLYLEAKRPAGA